MSQDQTLELYKLLSGQIEILRAAQREARRFYTLVNITGFSIVFGLQGEKTISPQASLAVVCGLLLLCTLWLNATTYYSRHIRLKSQHLLGLENTLGINLFADELKTLNRSMKLPNSFADRSIIAILIGAYIFLATFLAIKARLFTDPLPFLQSLAP